ncbi:MAG: hypothetical protein V4714_06995 [Bacteroidota bacterium]
MKRILLSLITTLVCSFASGQSIKKLDYCNCIDQVEQASPVLEGKFERVCDGKRIETGLFVNGKKEGEWSSYNKKGALLRKINYSQGQLNGKCDLYFANGNPKLTAFFDKGEKVGQWTYFTAKGKVFMAGEYESGKPVNTWTIHDKKGKAPAIQYDFKEAKYLINQPVALHQDNDIVHDDNSGQYYILRYPSRANVKGSSPLGGFHLSSDLFVELVEIPFDYWDTYTSYKYKATFHTSVEGKTSVRLESIANHLGNNVPIYPFIIKTNDDRKLKDVKHSDLSRKLLEFKILEALNFLPPWIILDQQETEIYIPYVINQIVGY